MENPDGYEAEARVAAGFCRRENSVSESTSFSRVRTAVGCGLLALGAAVFAVRFLHEGAYAMPRGGNLLGGLGAVLLGVLLVWPRQYRARTQPAPNNQRRLLSAPRNPHNSPFSVLRAIP